MKSFIRRTIAALAALLCLQAQADPILFLSPAAQKVQHAASINLDLWIRNVDTSLNLGGYDITLLFDPDRLRFNSLAFSGALGGPLDRIDQVSVTLPGVRPGHIDVIGVSLLTPAELHALQDDEFRLGTFNFTWIGGDGPTAVDFLRADLTDAFGNALVVGGLAPAVITLPEPGSLALTALGLLAMAGLGRRRGARPGWLRLGAAALLVAAAGTAQAQTGPGRFVAVPTGQEHVLLHTLVGGQVHTQQVPTPGLIVAEMAVADFDGDGRLDFLGGSNSNPSTVYLFRQLGNGEFSRALVATLSPDPKAAYEFAHNRPAQAPDYGMGLIAADLDNDGDADFLEAINVELRPNLFWIARGVAWLNDGAGNFTRGGLFNFESIFTGWTLGMSVTLGDVNGDNLPDLVASEQSRGSAVPSRVYVLYGRGNSFTIPVPLFRSPYAATFISMGDIDRNGTADVLLGMDDDGDPGQVYGFYGVGDGTVLQSPVMHPFDTRPDLESGNNAPGGGRFQLSDITGDGILDAVASPSKAGPDVPSHAELRVYPGLAGGHFAQTPIVLSNDILSGTAFSAPAQEFNAAGPQFLLAAANTPALDAYFTGNGSRFRGPVPIGGGPGAVLAEMAVADFDGDGDLDFIAGSNESPSQLYLFRRTGPEAFDVLPLGTQSDARADYYLGRGAPLDAPDYGLGLLPADLDNDGDIDFLAVENYEYQTGLFWFATATAWINDGQGGFTRQAGAFDLRSIYRGWTIGLSATLADLNHDGFPDLVASAQASGGPGNSTIHALYGRGDGSFGAPVPLLTVPVPATSLSLGDVNNDGAPDLVLGMDDDGDPGQVWTVFGHAGGGFDPELYQAFDSNPVESGLDQAGGGKFQLYDVSGDGILDIVASPLVGPTPATRRPQLQYYRGLGDGRFQLARQLGNILVSTGFSAPYGPAAPRHAPNDLNGDGVIDMLDVNMLLRAINPAHAAMGETDPFDINGDGTVNVSDVRALTLRCTVPGCGRP